MTYGQLLIELEGLKKEGDSFMKQEVVIRWPEGSLGIELAVTLPGRELIFVQAVTEADDAG